MALFGDGGGGGPEAALFKLGISPTSAPSSLSTGTFLGGNVTFGDAAFGIGREPRLSVPSGATLGGSDPLPALVAVGGLVLLGVMLWRSRRA